MVRWQFVFMFIHDSMLGLTNQSVRILAAKTRIELGCETLGDITTRLRCNRVGRIVSLRRTTLICII